ncbi:MAG: GNAT family N-acetyltransferase [Candidatus Thermoplasmatota archaeon]|nr:GNAT family N-acetyltransferase [Candidatus Thermoplasmatota archaeon]
MPLIRRFKKADLEKVYRISDISLKEEYPRELFISIQELWNQGFLVVEISNEVVGFICGVVENSKTSRILMLAVHPFYRNRGLGGEILKNFIEVSSNRGLSKVTLEVRVSSESVITFYQKRGFQLAGRLEDFYTDGEDGFKMVRYL